ncbi:hypothetical protein AWC38_SpisGene10006 [Stylophora pistillata]|uniref:Ig-like domain-containing protein n=1 Tax=Stylophora pistillata TaxID=50429 RepID=A0A2B4S8H4_STYPI|nr:hypothetical protein AWC38_SpisGene10006 [Stylophora pistillata]
MMKLKRYDTRKHVYQEHVDLSFCFGLNALLSVSEQEQSNDILRSATITEVYSREDIQDFDTTQLLRVPKGHYVEISFNLWIPYDLPGAPCADEEYLEIRDGSDRFGNLLGVFCGREIYVTLRSSGRNMWLRFSPHCRYLLSSAYFEGKALKATVATYLGRVMKTQFVLLNHVSPLWCPALGGPAPRIVWRRNGVVVQNSTSVRLQINVTEEERNTKYSCGVDDYLKRKIISLVVEKCPQPCQCKVLEGNMRGLVSANCEGKQLKSIPKKISRATANLELVGVDAPTAPSAGPVPTCQYIDPEDQVKRSFMFDPVPANELWR